MERSKTRILFLDHLRGFAFLLMAVDHCIHAYALHWGRFWFFQDTERSLIFDALYMHNNSVIMPLLFFVIGTFVIPGFQRYGLKGYLKNRFFRYVIPFCVGIPLSVPLLTYPRYVTHEAPGISFFTYWKDVFFVDKLQAGPLWVVSSLFAYTGVALLIYGGAPRFFKGLQRGMQALVLSPVRGFIILGLLSMVLLGVSDLIWGAPWWIGFGKVFHVQASRFLQQALFFFCGVALGGMGYGEREDLWAPFSKSLGMWFILTVVLGTAYVGYSLIYFEDGAYNDSLLYYLHGGGDWRSAGPLFLEVAPGRLLRTTLHGFFCLSQVIFFVGLFYRFCQKPSPFWDSLAANGFGLFLIHEMLVVLGQYWMSAYSFPIFFKILLVLGFGLGGGWGLSHLLRSLPGVRAVFGSYPKRG